MRRLSPSSVLLLTLFACGYLVLPAFAGQISAGEGSTGTMNRVGGLPDRPVELVTGDGIRIRMVVLTRGLSHPWGLAFLPDGRMLVTERPGRLRVIGRDGHLDPTPVAGVPAVFTGANLAGLMDVAVHPRFEDNGWVYLTYSKPADRDGKPGAQVALARGRFDGRALLDVRDLFVSNGVGNGTAASRILFGPDGMLYMTVGGAITAGQEGNNPGTGKHAQDPGHHFGKLLRLRDDGSAPSDNPFVGRPGHLSEIYTLGHRNQLGLAFHPETGALWASENGPLGGDEVNVILPGRNYGWPIVSYSREYSGRRVSDRPWQEGFEQPEIVWLPSIAPSGMTFYSGDRFPLWKGNLFVGSLRVGRTYATGHLERVVFNRRGEEQRRESLLGDFKQRIRDVRQGPDGLLYVLTEEKDAALLKIEPVE